MSTKLIDYVTTMKGSERVINEFKKLRAGGIGLATANQEVTRTTKLTDGTMLKVSGTFDRTGTKIRNLNYEVIKQKQAFATAHPILGGYMKALMRVAIVVPVWMAARAAIQAVGMQIRDSIQYFIDLDAATARAKATITGATDDIDKLGTIIQKVARGIAMETGKEIKDVVEVFYRLSTAGIDASTSLQSMNGVVKTAMALDGDLVTTARVLAQTYNLLGKTLGDTVPEFKKVELFGATIATMWQDNQFELNEFSQSLERAGGTMAQFNVDGRVTIAMLATLHQQGIKGGRAGRLLQTVFLKLGQNVNILRKELGIIVDDNKAIDWFSLLTQVLEKTNKLGTQVPSTVKKLLEVFNIRGGQAFRGLLQDMEKFRANLKIAGMDANELVANLNKLQQLKINTIETQLKIFGTMRKEVGLAFIMGVTGTNEFVSSLKVLNEWMKTLIVNSAIFGANIREWSEAINEDIPLPGTLGQKITATVIPFADIAFFKSEMGRAYAAAFKSLKKELDATTGSLVTENDIRDTAWKIVNNYEKAMTDGTLEKISKKAGKQMGAHFIDAYEQAMEMKNLQVKVAADLIKQLQNPASSLDDINVKIKALQDLMNKGLDGVGDTTNQYKDQLEILDELKAIGASEQQVLKEKLNILTQVLKLDETDTEVIDTRRALRLEELKILGQQAAKIRDITKSSLSDALKEGDLSGAFDSFKEGLRNATFDAIAEGLTNQVMNLTGLDTILGKGLETIQIERAFDNGALKVANAIDGAFDRGAGKIGGVGGNGNMTQIGGKNVPISPKDYYKTPAAGGSDAGTMQNWFGAGGNFWQLAGVGLMGASLFGGGGRTSNTSNRYSTAPGGTTSAATTRSTVKAKVTNIVLNATFNLPEGLGVEGRNLVKEVEGKITPLIRDITVRVLEEESISSGNI